MKKLYTLVTALIGALSCMAAPLSPQQALLRVAESNSAPTRIMGQSGNPQLMMTGNAQNGEAAYYVFTDASKTLFVSADDIAIPLLGYSDNGNFDPSNMSPELKWWLECYAEEIEWALNHTHSTLAVEGNKEKPARISGHAIAPMIATTWNQGHPYNLYCPVRYGERTVTGCVATSMAQVMNYYKWPQAEVAPISYEWDGTQLTSPATVIDWANMRDGYGYNYSDAQADAVARLMQLAGYSVKMQYNTSSYGGSGAYSIDIRGALVDKFGYDQATDYIQRDYYGTEEWAQKIYDNLANIGPVIYNGRGTNGGHSFVCDGYDGNGKFHMNWGWEGTSDGYFELSALNPGNLGIGGGAGGFNSGQGAVIGIRKPQSGSVAPLPVIGSDAAITGSVSGRNVTIAPAEGAIYNISPLTGAFTLGAMLTNVETGENINLESTVKNYSLQPGYGFYYYTVAIPATVPNGSYEVRSTYKVESGDWQLTKVPYGENDYFYLNVSASGLSTDTPQEAEITVKNYDYHSGFETGSPYQVDVTLQSTYQVEMQYSMDVYLCTKEDTHYYIVETLGGETLTIGANSEASFTVSGTLSSSLTPGTYYLSFANGSSIIGSVPVEVTQGDNSGEIRLKAYGFNLPFRTNQDYDFFMIVTSTMNKPAEYTLDACLAYEEGGYLYFDTALGSSTVTVPAHSDATMQFTGTLNGSVEAGKYYLCFLHGDNLEGYVEVDVNDGSGEITIKDIDMPSEFKTNEPYYFNVTVESTYDEDKDYTLEATLNTLEDNVYHHLLSLDEVTVTVPANSEATLDFSGTLDADIAPGIYYVVLRQGGMIVDSYEVEVTEGDDGSGEITLTQWWADNKFVAGETYDFYVIAESTYKHDEVYTLDAYLCVLDGYSYTIYANLGSATETVPAQSEATFSYTGTLNQNIEPGDYYLVWANNMNVVGSAEIAVTSNGKIICEAFTVEPEIVSVGEESKVTVEMSSTYQEEKTIDLVLYLCKYDPASGFSIRHSYGTETATFEPNGETALIFSTVIPEELEESDEYYLVLCDTDYNILDRVKVEMNFTVGVNNIAAEDESNYRYFNLQGIEVKCENLTPGIYIRTDGKKSDKILIK